VRGRRACVVLGACALLAGCGGTLGPGAEPAEEGAVALPTRYDPDRRDYASFALAIPVCPSPTISRSWCTASAGRAGSATC